MNEIVLTLSRISASTCCCSALLRACPSVGGDGIYSVLSYSVRRRVGEIGVRMALGAQRSDILRMILARGEACPDRHWYRDCCCFRLTRLMASQLFGVTVTDPVTFLSVALLIVLVALAACYIPARRATKVDPIVALRYDNREERRDHRFREKGLE